MAERLGQAVLELVTDDRRYSREMDRAEDKAERLDRGLERTGRSARTLGTRLRALGGRARTLAQGLVSLRSAAALAAGATGLFLLAKRSIAVADEMAKTARAIGISAEALQEYRFAAGRAGIAQEAFDQSLAGFSKRVGEARQGTGTLITLLKNLDPALLANVQAADSVEEAFDLVVDTASRMGNELDRNALLAAAFGRSTGVDMANLVQGGSAAIDQLRQRARELGVVLSEDVTRRAEQAADELGDMEQVLKVAAVSAGLELMPAMRMLAQALTDPDFIKSIGEISRLLTRFIIILVQLKDVLVPAVAGLIAFSLFSRVTKTQWAALMAVVTAGLAVWLQNQDGMSNTAEELDALTEAAARFVAESGDLTSETFATADSVRDLADALEMENTQLDQLIGRHQFGADAVAELRRELELENAATAANIDLSTDQGQRWAELFRRGQDLKTALDQVEEAERSAAATGDKFGRAFGSAMENAIVGGNDLRDVLRGLAEDLQRLILRAAVLGPLEQAIGGFFGGLFGGAGGGASAGATSSPLPVARAGGGRLGARTPAIVGERGIELFVPDVSGTVVPNDVLRGLGLRGGGDQFFIDARGADSAGLSRLEDTIRALNGSIERRAVGAVVDARRRNPRLFGAGA